MPTYAKSKQIKPLPVILDDRFYDEGPKTMRHWAIYDRHNGNWYFNKENEATRRHLVQRGPGEWAWRISELSVPCDCVRCHAACLIWWDFFGQRNAAERWPHLDLYIDAPYVAVPDVDCIDALIQAGYTKDMAINRMKNPVE